MEIEKLQNINSKKRSRFEDLSSESNENGGNEKQQNLIDTELSSNEYKKLKKDIEDLKANINEKFESLKIIISNLNSKETSEYPTELWFNGINLLDYGASNIQKYTVRFTKSRSHCISKLMEELYSLEELAESYVIDGNSTSKKKPLDLERLHKIRDAVYIKYRVPSNRRNEYWEIVKDKAIRKCLDATKKLKKNSN
ncbi:unnamed protein product [Brachionus calyciflorus]|uniref:BEN domain-containing protein n=1 Tax=Brachionus calyciflorus TaxID=104777 RepID=A0A814K6N2_9BILA|nr:unnamed protein product [Brachionus calyciflorus]